MRGLDHRCQRQRLKSVVVARDRADHLSQQGLRRVRLQDAPIELSKAEVRLEHAGLYFFTDKTLLGEQLSRPALWSQSNPQFRRSNQDREVEILQRERRTNQSRL